MISLFAIHQLYEYNCWARDRQLEACRALTAERFVKRFGGGWSCRRDQLAHLLDAEAYYLHHWRGHFREEIIAAQGLPAAMTVLKTGPQSLLLCPGSSRSGEVGNAR